ncbi:hypothetical protein [Thalassospira xiamenensis]|uniref:Uncharacterized protein n=1 Tax=Thalassospira xiamenensis TaxID=220697 RepID=A0A285TGY8_9PROT|nr:hypothetical protein [Thalassospira xiamenensis]SOC21465.1 hypothetical protein SAMN05428964_103411 [Thalassospira xiamenensis]
MSQPNRAIACYDHKGLANALAMGRLLFGDDLKVGTMLDLVNARCEGDLDSLAYTRYFATHSVCYLGYDAGIPKMVVTHGAVGPFANLDDLVSAWDREGSSPDVEKYAEITSEAFSELISLSESDDRIYVVDLVPVLVRLQGNHDLEVLNGIGDDSEIWDTFDGAFRDLAVAVFGPRWKAYLSHTAALGIDFSDRSFDFSEMLPELYSPVWNFLRLGRSAICNPIVAEHYSCRSRGNRPATLSLKMSLQSKGESARLIAMNGSGPGTLIEDGFESNLYTELFKPPLDLLQGFLVKPFEGHLSEELGEPPYKLMKRDKWHVIEAPRTGDLDTGIGKFVVLTCKEVGKAIHLPKTDSLLGSFLRYEKREIQAIMPTHANAYDISMIGQSDDGKHFSLWVQFYHVTFDRSRILLSPEQMKWDRKVLRMLNRIEPY